ncbi:hypothetical protein JW823_00810 [bacterium]|nr:hypothetical protein [candidate division CSSED10-310 bacterium]
MQLNRTILCLVLSLIAGPMVFAVTETQPRFAMGLRSGYYLLPNWSDTYDAIYDNSGEMMLGLEFGYRLTESLEIGVSADMISGDGERVWPDGSGNWEGTGESVSFDIVPIVMFSRFSFLCDSNLSPYLGIGIGYSFFKETDDESSSGFGFLGTAGIRWKRYSPFELLAEAEYSTFQGVIGEGDASEYFSEDDIGGVSIRICFRYVL